MHVHQLRSLDPSLGLTSTLAHTPTTSPPYIALHSCTLTPYIKSTPSACHFLVSYTIYMAPKPRPIQRKPSSATGNASALQKTPNPQAMPPPPVPVSAPAPPPPRGILVPEATALDGCFRVRGIRSLFIRTSC